MRIIFIPCRGVRTFSIISAMNTKIPLAMAIIVVAGFVTLVGGVYFRFLQAPETAVEQSTIETLKNQDTDKETGVIELVSYTKKSDIWIYDLSSGASSLVAKNAYYVNPRGMTSRWSFTAKSNLFAFEKKDQEETSIYLVSTRDFSKPQFLSLGTNPHFSPSGESILFQGGEGVRVIDLSNNQERAYKNLNLSGILQPWFGDGIRFLAKASLSAKINVYVVVNRITNERKTIDLPFYGSVRVSPTSDEFLGTMLVGEGFNFAVADMKGRIDFPSPFPSEAYPTMGYRSANWSPDGSRISYVDCFIDNPPTFPVCAKDLVIINKNGSGKLILKEGGYFNPCWLSSQKLVFIREDKSAELGIVGDLKLVDLETEREKNIDEGVNDFVCPL